MPSSEFPLSFPTPTSPPSSRLSLPTVRSSVTVAGSAPKFRTADGDDADGDLLVLCNFGAAERTVALDADHGTTDLPTDREVEASDAEGVVADAVVLDG